MADRYTKMCEQKFLCDWLRKKIYFGMDVYTYILEECLWHVCTTNALTYVIGQYDTLIQFQSPFTNDYMFYRRALMEKTC